MQIVNAAVIAGVLALLASSASLAQPKSDNRALRIAYEGALRCFVANTFVEGSFSQRGDSANASLFEQRARRAHDTAGGYGNLLRFTRDQMERDTRAATDRELPKLLRDASYLTEVARFCKGEGLM